MSSEVVSIPEADAQPEMALSLSSSVVESPPVASEQSLSAFVTESPAVQPEPSLAPSVAESGAKPAAKVASPPKPSTVSSPNPPALTRPIIPFSKKITAPLFDPDEPLIERLAAAARPKKEQPIAGWVGIQRLKEIDVEIPPECMLYESDHFHFQLGKKPPHRDYPQVIPENAWQPPKVAEEPEEKGPSEPAKKKVPAPEPNNANKIVTQKKAAAPTPKAGGKIIDGLQNVEEIAISALNEARELANDQQRQRVNPELAPPKTLKKAVKPAAAASPIGTPKGKPENKKLPSTPSTPKKKPSVSNQPPQRK